MITKGERAELRSLIKQRFRVLRADIEQRQAELLAELEDRINGALADDDKAWGDVAFAIGEAARDANRRANDAVRALVGRDGWPDELAIVRASSIDGIRRAAAQHQSSSLDRALMRRQGTTRIEATIKGALLELDRQEADLLTRLVAGTLETDDARAFLADIPTVSSLVPAVRLLELERSLKGGGDG